MCQPEWSASVEMSKQGWDTLHHPWPHPPAPHGRKAPWESSRGRSREPGTRTRKESTSTCLLMKGPDPSLRGCNKRGLLGGSDTFHCWSEGARVEPRGGQGLEGASVSLKTPVGHENSALQAPGRKRLLGASPRVLWRWGWDLRLRLLHTVPRP